jgi:hypothetical protein
MTSMGSAYFKNPGYEINLFNTNHKDPEVMGV